MLFFIAGWLHVLLAPYTKVEESFNLHATHDLLFYGPLPAALPNYDHFTFPGVVPRSFIGSLALSVAAELAARVANIVRPVQSKYELQVLVRLTLATANALGLFQLQRAVARRFGATVSALFMLLTCTQFHVPFWMGRTLPNMFALYPVNVALACVVAKAGTAAQGRRNFNRAVAILTFAAVTLRAELVLLLGPLVLQGLYLRRTSLLSVVRTGLVAGVLSLALTVAVDSYFWDQWPLWPEFAGLYFNVYEGKSAEWGTSPPHSYFAVHLPKLLLSALPLSVVGLLADARMQTLLVPGIAFVALLSCLGHKEWRFVVYVVPLWNIAAARGAAWLMSARVRGRYAIVSRAFFRLALLGCFGLNIIATVLLTQASMANYPGGEALRHFNTILAHSERTSESPQALHLKANATAEEGREVSVHIDNYAAQTGASLFLHEYASPKRFFVPPQAGPWNVVYNKTENLNTPDDFQGFDWVITERQEVFMDGGAGSCWTEEASVAGLRGVELRPLGERGWWAKMKVPRITGEAKLWLLKCN